MFVFSLTESHFATIFMTMSLCNYELGEYHTDDSYRTSLLMNGGIPYLAIRSKKNVIICDMSYKNNIPRGE